MSISQKNYNQIIDLFCHARIARDITTSLLSRLSLLTDNEKHKLILAIAECTKHEYEEALVHLYSENQVPAIFMERYGDINRRENRDNRDTGGLFYTVFQQTLKLECRIDISDIESQLHADFLDSEQSKLQYTGYYNTQDRVGNQDLWIRY